MIVLVMLVASVVGQAVLESDEIAAMVVDMVVAMAVAMAVAIAAQPGGGSWCGGNLLHVAVVDEVAIAGHCQGCRS